MDKQLNYGFWSLSHKERLYPKAITYVAEYDGSPTVTISCTQLLDADEKKKKHILKDWIEAIPSLPVHFVRFSCHVPEALLEAVCQNRNLKGLFIKWTKAKSIASLECLENLEELYLGSGAAIKDATPLQSLVNLRVLTLENLKYIRDYSFLGKLVQLVCLSIEGGMYSRPFIEDLQFVSSLINLHSFSLVAMRCPNPSLEPFRRLTNLENLHLCCDFPENEKRQLEARLPNLRYGFEYYRQLQERNLA